MALNLKTLEPDEAKVRDGVWLEYGDPAEGAKLKIGYARGAEFQRKAGKLTNVAMAQTKGRKLEADAIRNLNRRAMVGTLLKDFEGLEIDRVPLPKETPEQLAASILAILHVDLIYEFVQEEAANLSNFKEEGDESAKAEAKRGTSLEPPVG